MCTIVQRSGKGSNNCDNYQSGKNHNGRSSKGNQRKGKSQRVTTSQPTSKSKATHVKVSLFDESDELVKSESSGNVSTSTKGNEPVMEQNSSSAKTGLKRKKKN